MPTFRTKRPLWVIVGALVICTSLVLLFSVPRASSSSSSPAVVYDTAARPQQQPFSDPKCVASAKKRTTTRFLPTLLRDAKYNCQNKVEFLSPFQGEAVVVEVGAYDGEETPPLAKVSKKVYSFEANINKENGIRAKWRQMNAPMDKIELTMAAVTNFTGNIKLYVPSGKGGSQQDSPGNMNFFSGNNDYIDVPAVKLDDVIHEHVHMLKSDSQGHEFHVLQGALKLIENYGIDILHLEYAPKLLEANGVDPVYFLHWLRDLGYLCFDCQEFGPPPIESGRSFEAYGKNFGAFIYMKGDTGKWADIVCYDTS